jgi:hypothetical protein
MGTLALQPLSEEAILEKGLFSHQLWMIMLHEETFGPFDTEMLKAHAEEDQDFANFAFAAKMDQDDWSKFSDCPEFRKASAEPEPIHDLHVLPKLPKELNVYKIKSNSDKHLPNVPEQIAEVLSHDHHNPVDLKIEEVTLESIKSREFNFSFLWGAPVALAVLLGLGMGGYYLTKPNLAKVADISDLPEEKVLGPNGFKVTPTRREPAYREPSSVRPFEYSRSGLTQPSYPTRTESHDYNRDIDHSDPGMDNPPPSDDMALADTPGQDPEPQSLEGAMGGSPQPEANPSEVPIMESSDF